jgi:RNA recognition motif-containing protein
LSSSSSASSDSDVCARVHAQNCGTDLSLQIRSMYTQCKHRGFVMISYFDIRDAKTAMQNLQNKVVRGRKLDIHYSIPKVSTRNHHRHQNSRIM